MSKCEAGNYSVLTMPRLFNLKSHNSLWIVAKQKNNSIYWMYFFYGTFLERCLWVCIQHEGLRNVFMC